MLSENLLERIMNRVSPDPVKRNDLARERMQALNLRLLRQQVAQRMTEEVLNKRCTL